MNLIDTVSTAVSDRLAIQTFVFAQLLLYWMSFSKFVNSTVPLGSIGSVASDICLTGELVTRLVDPDRDSAGKPSRIAPQWQYAKASTLSILAANHLKRRKLADVSPNDLAAWAEQYYAMDLFEYRERTAKDLVDSGFSPDLTKARSSATRDLLALISRDYSRPAGETP